MKDTLNGLRVWLADYNKAAAGGSEIDWKYLAGSARVTFERLLTAYERGEILLNDTLTLDEALSTRFMFGKYKGFPINEVFQMDPDYLDWCVNTLEKKPGLVRAIRLVLQHEKDRHEEAKRRNY